MAKKQVHTRAIEANAAALSLPSSTVQNEFGRILDQAMDHDIVVTRHDVPRAVLVSARRYQQLLGREAVGLQSLQSQFDALYDRMQTPAFKVAMQRGFSATPKQMGKAAKAAVARRKAGARKRG